MAKSVGQWVGTIVGAVIGFWTGGTSYVALGAAVGGATGGAIDPPKGPKIVWPRLSDLSVQTASYGAPIPRVYGTVGLYGNVVWIENNQLLETEKTEGGGKGGGGKPETTTYSYSVTCAILLCEGPIVGVRRIWAGAKLIYDAGDSTPESIIASNATLAGITIYNGDDTQMPNARMQMTLGAGNVSAWRGKAYVVIEDFQLADYGNSMLGCPFKFEVMSAATFDQYSQPTYVPEYAFPQFSSYGPILGRIESGTMKFDHLGRTYTLSANGTLVNEAASDLGTFPTWGHVGMLGNQPVDFTLAGTFDGWLTVAGANLMYHYPTNATLPAGVWHMMGAAVDKAGTRLYVLAHRESDHTDWLQIYDDDLNLLSQGSQSAYQFVVNAGSYPLVQGTSEVFTVEEGGNYLWYVNAFPGTVSVYPISSGVVGSAQHTFVYGTTPFMGPHGSHLTIAAADAMCWGAHDGGGMFIFSRAITCTPALVDLSDIVTAECLSTGYLSSGDLDTSTLTAQIRGYRIANNSAIRAALEALQAPFPFDVIQDGYKIKFVKRGANSVATVAYDDMAATASAASSNPRITTSREMDAQLPRRIEVTYFDASREYDTGEQAAERLNSTGTGILKIEVPIVMTADEGAQCADMLLYLYHLERLDVEFVVPMCDPYNKLQPADPVTVVTPDATYFVRITSITQESDRTVKITARLADVALYSPTSVGAVSNVLSRPISLTGPSLLTILDIPTISSDNEIPGLVLAGRGAYSGWRGGDVMRSDDGGVSWISQAWISAPGATAAVASNYLGTGPTNAMDVSSVLNVALLSGSISSVSEMALFNGANHFAYGEPGRWEIIAARTVALQSDGTYNLSNLLRGRFGTEWAMTTHIALDDVILLTSGSLNFTDQPTSSIGSARQWTILGYGDSGAQQNSRTFTYAGENLECLPPVYAKGYKNASNDFVMEWLRRSRTDSAWRDYVDCDMGEASEAYQVEIYEDDTYATIKRTITGLTTPAATYTSAQQTTDFGSVQRYLFAKIYQVSANVGTGYECRAFIGNPKLQSIKSLIHFDGTGGDIYFANVSLLMHMDDTGLTDVTGKTIALNGGAARSATQSQFGGYSAYFDGAGDYLSTPGHAGLSFGSGDFTIEGFFYLTSNTSLQVVFDTRGTAADYACALVFSITSSGKLRLSANSSAADTNGIGWDIDVTGSTTVTTGAFHHIAAVRYGNAFSVYLDGVADATGTWSGTVGTGAANVFIGAGVSGVGTLGYFLNGYLDEFRITKGVARYTATFTPDAAAFSNSVPSAIVDSAGNSIAVTGAAGIIDTDSQFGGACLLAKQSAGYISTPQILLSDTKWVVDFWVKPVSIGGATYSGILQFGQAADGTGGFCVVTRYDGLAMCFFAYSVAITGDNLSTSAFRHCFIQRNGNYLTMGTNGTTGAGRTVSGTTDFVPSVKRTFDIGYSNVTYIDPRDVKIDEFQVRIGEAPYPTSDYTAYTIPTSAFDNP